MESVSALAADLALVARTRTWFGHQSVGLNILDGIAEVYSENAVATPPIVSWQERGTGALIGHDFIGSNFEPIFKIEDFAAKVRGGVGAEVDVAVMKLCYVDIDANTDADALFDRYRETLADLEREHPDVTFVHVTAPLTTGHSPDNVNRERYNAQMRQAYADGGHLFDLAAIESTDPDGNRVKDRVDGDVSFAMYAGYSDDGGHLNATGSSLAAKGLVAVIADSQR
ncbi:MAG: SGNH/GDSL hydrolase family protein [Propionicimonas sp.]